MGVDPQLWRTYRLLTDLGLKPSEADEMSAVDLDWLLAMHSTIQARRARG
jgi:hypothetical protein